MKNIFNTINNWLLERHPNIWNTRLLWMLLIGLIFHIGFYLLGLLALSTPASLKRYDALYIFFSNGMVLLSVMISIISLVAWILILFRNNSFKNFYPTTAWDLWKQYIFYFVIVIFQISYFISYTLGVQTYIQLKYTEELVGQEVGLTNDAYPFTSHELGNYELSSRKYPPPLDTLYCSQQLHIYDGEGEYLSFKDHTYQYYTTKRVKRNPRVAGVYSDSIYAESGYNEDGNISEYDITYDSDTNTYVVRDKLVSIPAIIKSARPSYYNFTGVFYNYEKDKAFRSDSFYEDYAGVEEPAVNIQNLERYELLQAKRHQEFLNKADADEFRKLLSSYLQLMDKYEINYNINESLWFDIVYHPEENFAIKKLINSSSYDGYSNAQINSDIMVSGDESDFEVFRRKISTKYFIESSEMKEVFSNIKEIKETNIIINSIHVFIWIAFVMSLLLFIFRTTGLKELLFAGVTIGVISVVLGLIFALFNFVGDNSSIEYIFSFIVLFVGFSILLVAFVFSSKLNKTISAVLLNISLTIFLPLIFLILGIITMYQQDQCRARNSVINAKYVECETLLETFELGWSYIFLAIGIVYIYLYSLKIRSWRAQPEN